MDSKRPTLIQVSVSAITAAGITLDTTDYINHKPIATGLTIDEVFALPDSLIAATYWPTGRDIPTTSFDNPRQYADALVEAIAHYAELREEEAMTRRADRRVELSRPNGLVNRARMKTEVLKMLVAVTIHATIGCWPMELRERMQIV